jgi:transposase
MSTFWTGTLYKSKLFDRKTRKKIRDLHEYGVSTKALAARFGVNVTKIQKLIREGK